MAYEKHTWETGEVITAEKLNHMEDGIGAGTMAVTVTSIESSDENVQTEYSCDKTLEEIVAAYANGLGNVAIMKQTMMDGELAGDPAPYRRVVDVYVNGVGTTFLSTIEADYHPREYRPVYRGTQYAFDNQGVLYMVNNIGLSD